MSRSERAPRVLVLGGGGFIGSAVMRALEAAGMTPIAGLRVLRGAQPFQSCLCDATDLEAVTREAAGADYAVNAVLGSACVMKRVTETLCEAARKTGLRRVVHLSSMSVYGDATGSVDEQAPLAACDWYGAAKIDCERIVQHHAAQGGEAVILRPGIVYGPGGEQWTARIGRLLRAGRIGDLGEAGDGFCNLAHVDDVAAAAVAALRMPDAAGQAINVAGSGRLRWNDYFVMFGCALGAVPVSRVGRNRLKFEARVLAPALRAARPLRMFPDPISTSLLGLWRRDMVLNCGRQAEILGVEGLPVEAGVAASAAWLSRNWGLERNAQKGCPAFQDAGGALSPRSYARV